MDNTEKFEVNYSETSYFKGIRILHEYISEGITYAIKNNIADVCIWSGGNAERQTINFDFLNDIQSLTTFHFLVPLSKKSDISGLYKLDCLKNFRWAVDNDFAIDFENLSTIEKLNLSYSSKLTNWRKLVSLRELYIQSIKTNDCSFLEDLKMLEKLRIINAKLTSLKGLENCKNLKEIRLVKCAQLSEVNTTLSKLGKLESLSIEKCKKLVIDESKLSIEHISIIK